MRPEQERVKKLLTEAVTLLCRNSLQFKEEVCVEGLIGITLDKSDIFLVSINERVEQAFKETAKRVSAEKDGLDKTLDSPNSARRRKRREQDCDSPALKRERRDSGGGEEVDSEGDSRGSDSFNVHVKQEGNERLRQSGDNNTGDKRTLSAVEWDVSSDGRSVHPAHDSSSLRHQTQSGPHAQDHDRGGGIAPLAQNQSSPAKLALNHPSMPAQQNRDPNPSDVPQIKQESAEEPPDECYVVDSGDDSMSEHSRSNPIPMGLAEAQLVPAQGWSGAGDGMGGFAGFQDPDMLVAAQQFPNLSNLSQQFASPGGSGNNSNMFANMSDMSFANTSLASTSQQSADGSPRGGPFTCNECGKSYKQQRNLWSHTREVHQGYCVSCPLCGKQFKRKSHLRVHVVAVHDTSSSDTDNTVMCHICQKKFGQKNQLERHLAKAHHLYSKYGSIHPVT